MRESYFTTQVAAVLEGLRESTDHSEQLGEILYLIEGKLHTLLQDHESPERQWRHKVAAPLTSLADAMRVSGRPLPSVEALALELSY